jgi:hypothetical protein
MLDKGIRRKLYNCRCGWTENKGRSRLGVIMAFCFWVKQTHFIEHEYLTKDKVRWEHGRMGQDRNSTAATAVAQQVKSMRTKTMIEVRRDSVVQSAFVVVGTHLVLWLGHKMVAHLRSKVLPNASPSVNMQTREPNGHEYN